MLLILNRILEFIIIILWTFLALFFKIHIFWIFYALLLKIIVLIILKWDLLKLVLNLCVLMVIFKYYLFLLNHIIQFFTIIVNLNSLPDLLVLKLEASKFIWIHNIISLIIMKLFGMIMFWKDLLNVCRNWLIGFRQIKIIVVLICLLKWNLLVIYLL